MVLKKCNPVITIILPDTQEYKDALNRVTTPCKINPLFGIPIMFDKNTNKALYKLADGKIITDNEECNV